MKLFTALWHQTKKRFAKLLYRFAIYHWVAWSKIYRVVWLSKYKGVEVDQNLPLTEVQGVLGMLEWKPDDLRELFDMCGTPNYVQHIINISRENLYKQGPRIRVRNIQPDLPLDCNEFAIWAAHAIDKNFYPRLFIFSWLSKHGEIVSHVTCLCRQQDGRIFHIGNWGTSGPAKDLREVSIDIIDRTRAREAIGWAILDKNLKVLKIGKELPSGSIN